MKLNILAIFCCIFFTVTMLSAQDKAGMVPFEEGSSRMIPKTITSDLGMTFNIVPAGRFVMGSYKDELYRNPYEDRHYVDITKPFYIGIHEVTVGDFKKFVTATGYKTEAETDGKGGWGIDSNTMEYVRSKQFTWKNPGFTQEDSHPVVNVSWNDAQKYIQWLNTVDSSPKRLATGARYALPTEAQWEYAARGNEYDGSYPLGEDPEDLVKIGNVGNAVYSNDPLAEYMMIRSNDGYEYTAPVGQFLPNGFGLYDMIGNVMEWCSDWYRQKYYDYSPEYDPLGPELGKEKVVRGGSWYSHHAFCRAAFRGMLKPNERFDYVGFRVVISLEIGEHL